MIFFKIYSIKRKFLIIEFLDALISDMSQFLEDLLMFVHKSCPSNSLIFLFEISGHLDRVVHGHIADDILTACDEHTVSVNVGENVGSNPALHFFRGLRHRNLAAIKLAAQSGINQIQGQKSAVDQIQVSFLNFF